MVEKTVTTHKKEYVAAFGGPGAVGGTATVYKLQDDGRVLTWDNEHD